MKKPDLTRMLLSATLFLGAGLAAQAQETPPPPSPDDEVALAPPPPVDESIQPPPVRAELIKKFDKNGDGKLDDAEKAEARKAFGKNHPRLAEKMRSAKRGPGNEDFRRGFMLGKFDQNGDGKLDDTERAAARAEGEKRMRAGLEKELQRLKAIDADGDGKISDSEWAASKAQREKTRAEHGERGPRGEKGERRQGPDRHDGPPPPPLQDGQALAPEPKA